MADLEITLTIEPHILCDGAPARIGDSVIIELDQTKFPDASNIPGEITDIEDTTAQRRGCATELVCGKSYDIIIDDSTLPDGVETIENCDVTFVGCASCCDLWNRMEHFKVVLQPNDIATGDYYTQIRAVEDLDIYRLGVWLDTWPSVYGDPGPHTDVVLKMRVSAVGGNTPTADVSGVTLTLLRATPEVIKNVTLASPVRIEAGRQIYLTVTDDGGSVPPKGLGGVMYFRRANE